MALNIRSKQVDNSVERLICIGMIVSDKVLKQISTILSPNMLTARYAKIVCKWCLDFYKQYEKAPKQHIQDIFETEKGSSLDDDVADLIESFLISLNEQAVNGTQFDEEFYLEKAEEYVKLRKAKMLCEDVTTLLENGRVEEAEGLISGYSIPARPVSQGVDVFSNDFWTEKEKDNEVLFRYPGALDDLFGGISRDSFISFIAPEKTGKSWYLLYSALTAYRQGCNVLFLSVGDMTEAQVRSRLRHMLTGVDPKRCKETVMVPCVDCYHNQLGACPLGEPTDSILIGDRKARNEGTYDDFPDHIPCTRCMENKDDMRKYFMGTPWHVPMKIDDIEKDLEKACDNIKKRARGKRLRLICTPPTTMNVAKLNTQLDILEQSEGFVPDVILLDYADILEDEPGSSREEKRNRINITWMALRKLSQERNCALLVATQSKVDVRKKTQVDQWDVSEDKRKLAHVTSMWALNQTPEEKKKGIMRISNIAMRDGDFDVNYHVEVLSCLAIGKPVMFSYPHKSRDKVKEGKGMFLDKKKS